MKIARQTTARKRPVNLTLNTQLIREARGMTDNLSGVVEILLEDFVSKRRQQATEKTKAVQATIAVWNAFADKVGSFADEHSTL